MPISVRLFMDKNNIPLINLVQCLFDLSGILAIKNPQQ